MNNPDEILEEAIDSAKADEALADIDVGYIRECIDDQLDDLLSTETKKNYLKVLEKQLEENDIDEEYVKSICENLYTDIIDKISEKFEFTIDTTEVPLNVLAKTLYKFFIVFYADNVVFFIETAIIEHQKEIITELANRDGINTRHIEGVSSKISLILNNISDVIDIIDGLDLNFEDYIQYIVKHEDSKASAEQMIEYESRYMSDTEAILPIIMKSLINEDEGFANIYTQLQQNIYKRFVRDKI